MQAQKRTRHLLLLQESPGFWYQAPAKCRRGTIWKKYFVEPFFFFLLFASVLAAIGSSFVFLVYLTWQGADLLFSALSYAAHVHLYCSALYTQQFFICDQIYVS